MLRLTKKNNIRETILAMTLDRPWGMTGLNTWQALTHDMSINILQHLTSHDTCMTGQYTYDRPFNMKCHYTWQVMKHDKPWDMKAMPHDKTCYIKGHHILQAMTHDTWEDTRHWGHARTWRKMWIFGHSWRQGRVYWGPRSVQSAVCSVKCKV